MFFHFSYIMCPSSNSIFYQEAWCYKICYFQILDTLVQFYFTIQAKYPKQKFIRSHSPYSTSFSYFC